MLLAIEPVLVAERPDASSSKATRTPPWPGGLAAAKLASLSAHVEAGLRSFDRRMPEEINRVVADHLSTWLFAPTPSAVANLGHGGDHARAFISSAT